MLLDEFVIPKYLSLYDCFNTQIWVSLCIPYILLFSIATILFKIRKRSKFNITSKPETVSRLTQIYIIQVVCTVDTGVKDNRTD